MEVITVCIWISKKPKTRNPSPGFNTDLISETMMKLLLLVCALVPCFQLASAECNILQRGLVTQQWSEAVGFADDRDRFNLDLWARIFEEIPETIASHFGRVRGENIFSPEFRAHASRIFAGFDMSLSLLTDEPVLTAHLLHLKNQHAAYNLDDTHFDVFRTALLEVAQKRIGRCFDQDAWLSCVQLIEDGMKQG